MSLPVDQFSELCADIWSDYKLQIGIGCLALAGYRYGVPNLRYLLLIFRDGYLRRNEDNIPAEMMEYEFTVTLTDIDPWLHMNNAAYLRYAEAARLAWIFSSFRKDQLQKGTDGKNSALLALVSAL